MVKDYDGADYPDAMVEPAAGFAGVPDGFQRLWTPHRIAYVEAGQTPPDAECVFCTAPTLTDEQALIVHRGELAYVLLNLFPYNSGHLLVVPYRHVGPYVDATPDETAEISALTQTAMRTVSTVSRPEGFNVGMNLGAAAGAGIAAHLHQHVVPRWAGDTNFLPIIGRTKALPELLADTRTKLAEAWPTA
ncbi:MAG: HIT domain-containing protein [Microbacteriaceae bacterium]